MASSNVDSSSSPYVIEHDGVDSSDDITPLQKHVRFFDRNGDGLIHPWETFQGCRAIGMDFFLSLIAAIVVNPPLSSATRPGKSWNLLSCFPIEVENIHRAKHTSDSGAFDAQGRFVPSKFEEIFSKHSKTVANALTSDELQEMLQANKEPTGRFGDKVAAFVEWKVLFKLAKDENGLLQKEKIQAFYDGSLFDQLANEKASAKKNSLNLISLFFYF